MIEVGLLASNTLSEFKINTLKPILDDNLIKIKVTVIDNRTKESLIQKLKKNIKRGRGGYILIMALKTIFSKRGLAFNTKELCRSYGIEVIETDDPYSNDTILNIRKYNLDVLLLIGGFGIIKAPLLSITPLGILSYHHGNMRKYRGTPPAFWELYNNENEMGVTVQIITSGLDCGIPIAEKGIEIRKDDTLNKLQRKVLKESENMMYEALKKLSNQDFIPIKIETFGKVYSLPNLRQWIIFNIKILRRRLL